jgi:hypothetical protein
LSRAEVAPLLELADAIGYARCDWEYEDWRSQEVNRHPVFQQDADAAKAVWDDLQARLASLLAGLPE